MICTECVGTLSESREVYKEELDLETGKVQEKFYKTQISMGEYTFPAVGSEFVLRDLKGKVAVQVYLRSERGEGGKLFTFIQIITCEKVSEDEADKNEFDLQGTFKERKKMSPNNKGQENIAFTLKYTSYDKNISLVHCYSVGFLARRLNAVEDGDTIRITGYLRTRRDIIEIKAEKIISHVPATVGR